MYRNLLFDVDDTLLDFKAGELKSLAKTFAQLGVQYTPAIEARYLTVNTGLWQDYEAGEIPREQIFARRFNQVFQQMHIQADGRQAERVYHKLLAQQAIVGRHVQDTLAALQDYHLFVVSNGVETVQHERLTKAGIIDYFDDIFVSDGVGAPKPTLAFFDYVARHVPHFTPQTALIMGDSLTSDIQGGINAKIDQVWYNPTFVPNRRNLAPTYQLNEFSDLTKILAEQAS